MATAALRTESASQMSGVGNCGRGSFADVVRAMLSTVALGVGDATSSRFDASAVAAAPRCAVGGASGTGAGLAVPATLNALGPLVGAELAAAFASAAAGRAARSNAVVEPDCAFTRIRLAAKSS